MRRLLLVGIGAGDPEYLTVAAIRAMNEADVFFVMDKGPAAHDLVERRRALCARFVRNPTYRFVEVPDPVRDRESADYRPAVEDWRRRRVAVYERLIRDELAEDGCGAFLIWGDPALYDGTLDVVAEVAAHGEVPFEYSVIPGISSVAALAARHRIPINQVGAPVRITPGRLLAEGFPPGDGNVVVMLDSTLAWREIDDPEIEIFWGAYLGTEHELLVSGPVTEAGPRIEAARARARAEHGWVMDTYLLRRRRR